jgi:dephospho-CoA kinase
MRKFLIGVTGGFSSGKTTVSDMLVSKGARKINADKIAHEILLNDNNVKKQLIRIFGKDILVDGDIDRQKLSDIVFNDRTSLNILSSVIHPVIVDYIEREIRRSDNEIIVIDAPLLIESGLYRVVDYIVVVASAKKYQLQRGQDRGYGKEKIEKIILNQLSLDEKIEAADFVIKNNQDIDNLKKGVDKLWQILKKKRKKN